MWGLLCIMHQVYLTRMDVQITLKRMGLYNLHEEVIWTTELDMTAANFLSVLLSFVWSS